MTRARAGGSSVLLFLAVLALLLLALYVYVSNQPKGQGTASTPGAPASAPATGAAPSIEIVTSASGPTAPVNTAQPTGLAPFGLPQSKRPLEILDKQHFAIGYDDDALEPAWVVYPLSGPIVETGKEKRPARFATDPAVAHPSQHDDYDRSGFDRGHMCPAFAEWSRFGTEGMTATFVTSNIIPQRGPLGGPGILHRRPRRHGRRVGRRLRHGVGHRWPGLPSR
jgi:DNA/RNA endonuclease G (NUC1)